MHNWEKRSLESNSRGPIKEHHVNNNSLPGMRERDESKKRGGHVKVIP